ncbi:MAG: ABC transporter substrate-binding protein [Magnetococcales bacterium]|nr:ABC transporter substrate-binding protein [Magnetococcales bacterium]MBF0418979.1 ABC transporter substrate-binding protein [Magnetococcales bacterium]
MWRHFISMGLSALVLCLVIVTATNSLAASGALKGLESTVNQAIAVLRDPAYSGPGQKETRRKVLQDIIYPRFDFQRMAQASVGLPWKKFTPDQQKRFSIAFRTMLENTYLGMIERYSGEEVHFTNEVPVSAEIVRIDSVVVSKGQKYEMSYRLAPKGDQWLVFDVIIEGVSVVSNYRSQLKQLLHAADPDIEGVISKMQDKNIENQR